MHEDEYRVQRRAGVTLVFAETLALDDLSGFAKMAPPDAVLSPRLANMRGAFFAWGVPDAVDALIAETIKEFDAANPSATPIERWLAVGDRGLSSNALAHHLFGVHLSERSEQRAYPRDVDDLSRCIGFLDDVPGARVMLRTMSTVSPVWTRLVSNWNELELTFVSEVGPDWRSLKTWKAPKTTALLHGLVK